jgi:hypothetical protein
MYIYLKLIEVNQVRLYWDEVLKFGLIYVQTNWKMCLLKEISGHII